MTQDLREGYADEMPASAPATIPEEVAAKYGRDVPTGADFRDTHHVIPIADPFPDFAERQQILTALGG